MNGCTDNVAKWWNVDTLKKKKKTKPANQIQISDFRTLLPSDGQKKVCGRFMGVLYEAPTSLIWYNCLKDSTFCMALTLIFH